tara:strand:+ start:677 stop:2464 length:1788 start_codon:yes stop_codon:yes gene_type:complete
MNMFGTGNREEDELLKLLRQRKQRLIDAGAGGLLRETATGMSDDQLLEQLMMDQLEIGEKARDVPRDTSSPQDQVVSADRAMRGAPTQGIISPRLRSNIADISRRQQEEADRRVRIDNYEEQGPQAEGTDVLNVRTDRDRSLSGMPASVANSIGAISTPYRDNFAVEKAEEEIAKEEQAERVANYESQGPPTFMQQGRDVDIIGGESSRSAGANEREPTSGQSVGLTDPRARAAKPTTQTADTVTEPTTDADQRGLLSRIGSLIANNPEAVASGAQLLGGLISNAAQNRAQRRADRTTDQRVARANLISAITGGRARPTVERAQADTGGFMSLDTLGKALQGGGAAVKGELARRDAEDERERKAGLDERAAELAEAQAESLDAYRKGTLGQREKEFNAQQELLKKQAEQALAEQGEVNLAQLRANVKDVDDGLGLRKTGGYLDSSQGPKKLYNDMRVLFRQFEEDPNSANIMGIIQVYQRLFDPATVREGDIALMREAEGRIKQAVASVERVIGDGGVVSSFMIEDMKKAADDVHAMQLAKAKADVRAYTSRLFSANERKVLDEYYDDILSVRELPGEGEGSFISDLSGAKLNLD